MHCRGAHEHVFTQQGKAVFGKEEGTPLDGRLSIFQAAFSRSRTTTGVPLKSESACTCQSKTRGKCIAIVWRLSQPRTHCRSLHKCLKEQDPPSPPDTQKFIHPLSVLQRSRSGEEAMIAVTRNYEALQCHT